MSAWRHERERSTALEGRRRDFRAAPDLRQRSACPVHVHHVLKQRQLNRIGGGLIPANALASSNRDDSARTRIARVRRLRLVLVAPGQEDGRGYRRNEGAEHPFE